MTAVRLDAYGLPVTTTSPAALDTYVACQRRITELESLRELRQALAAIDVPPVPQLKAVG